MRGRHRGIVVPPDGVLGQSVTDGEFVLCRTAGVLSGFDDKRAALGNARFAGGDSSLVKPGFIPVLAD
jgi:hypothetical protein